MELSIVLSNGFCSFDRAEVFGVTRCLENHVHLQFNILKLTVALVSDVITDARVRRELPSRSPTPRPAQAD